jgi:putative tryptophan/tyrosine transport system substrate-binding protein
MNYRRKLTLALGAGALTASLPSRAQQPAAAAGKIWRVGFLASPGRPANLDAHYYGAFKHGMRDLGYDDGKNLVIEWRFADGDTKRLAGLAAELLQLKVDLITTAGNDAASAAQSATATIPIVMGSSADPVDNGLIKSLARPGGNMTGLSDLGGELAPKRLEMLLAMTAAARSGAPRIALLLLNTTRPNSLRTRDSVVAAAQAQGATILPLVAATAAEIETAFAAMRALEADALIVMLVPFFQQQRGQIAQLALKHRLPSMTADRQYPEAGCLMSYGPNLADNFRRAAYYVDQIFKGAKPADLPVEQPTRIELVINGKTATALGLKIPQSLLISADRVIE